MPALMEELVEEILLRVAPDEPAHLFRAALACKPWRRILTDAGFLRRYRAFHRAPPLLGYLHNRGDYSHARKSLIPPLVPTSAASPLPTQPPVIKSRTWLALDCRHGRVLIHGFSPDCLVVWDPITGGHKELSLPEYDVDDTCCYAGAVLCAVDGCNHLNCHDGPFLVVYAGSVSLTWAVIYSSETGLWSAPIFLHVNHDTFCCLATKPSLLIGDVLYFSSDMNGNLLKCDLGRHELSVIESPGWLGGGNATAMEVDGGELGFVFAEDNRIYMWSWQADAKDGTDSWAQQMVMELETLLPTGKPLCSHEVVGLLEGTYTIFISVTGVGVFTLDLKSRKVKKVGERGDYYAILPYTSFCTPDLAKDTHTVTSVKTH